MSTPYPREQPAKPRPAAPNATPGGEPLLALPYLCPVPAPSDIGISTSAYAGDLLAPALARIAELECEAGLAPSAEIRSFGLHTLLSSRNRRTAVRAGLDYTVHGPFGYTGIADVDEGLRLEALDEHHRHLEASAEIGARLYVVHPDWRPVDGAPRDVRVLAALAASFTRLLDIQEEHGVEIVVENMPGAGHSHFTAPGDLDLRGLGFALDVGHAAISGTLDAFLAASPAEWRHTHLHSNHGVDDLDDPHLPMGVGVVNAAAVLAAARAAGASVVLELNSADDVAASLAYLRGRGLIA